MNRIGLRMCTRGRVRIPSSVCAKGYNERFIQINFAKERHVYDQQEPGWPPAEDLRNVEKRRKLSVAMKFLLVESKVRSTFSFRLGA